MTTVVAKGRGKGIVVRTGEDTEVTIASKYFFVTFSDKLDYLLIPRSVAFPRPSPLPLTKKPLSNVNSVSSGKF
jgi:hypothetical protein